MNSTRPVDTVEDLRPGTTDLKSRETSPTSRKVRIIRRDSFRFSDRGDDWAFIFRATWWHQVRGVKGFHERLIFAMGPKSDFPSIPTVDAVVDSCNAREEHTWLVQP